MSFPEIGKLAPNFKLPDQDGNIVELENFRGKTALIVYFYPRASTPGCTLQACGLRDVEAQLKEKGYLALGISFDPVAKIKKFQAKYQLNFPLLSDEDHAVIEQYGCWQLKKFMGREFMGTVRTTFIVAKDGRLLNVMTKFKTKSHHETLLDVLSELD